MTSAELCCIHTLTGRNSVVGTRLDRDLLAADSVMAAKALQRSEGG